MCFAKTFPSLYKKRTFLRRGFEMTLLKIRASNHLGGFPRLWCGRGGSSKIRHLISVGFLVDHFSLLVVVLEPISGQVLTVNGGGVQELD